jgi:hypothetical protein
MTHEPEKIWICSLFGEYEGSYFPEAVEAEGAHGGTATEYTRSDIAQEQVYEVERKLGMVAAYLKDMTERGDDEAKALLDGLDLDYEHDDENTDAC